ncbi:Hypothetical predicted protein [Octopus vulgaris]|uniref:Uncharacterized protein n=1 Tax=Octopus vulgaris TaxID=6645 RepID=A0AA36F6U6_OCTVU|nr:Hypothetical predicted protein [Octopus vulgaris]
MFGKSFLDQMVQTKLGVSKGGSRNRVNQGDQRCKLEGIRSRVVADGHNGRHRTVSLPNRNRKRENN